MDAPTGIRPEDNVVVRLCNIYNDFGTPLRDCPSSPFPDRVKNNLDYLKAIDGWHALTENLFYLGAIPRVYPYMEDPAIRQGCVESIRRESDRLSWKRFSEELLTFAGKL